MLPSQRDQPSPPFEWVRPELERLRSERLLRERRVVRPLEDGWCEVDGRRLLNFASNDYLGLGADARVREVAARAAEECGAGARASALVSGRSEWHERLEAELAAFENTEAAVLFPTGYAANVGAVAALVGQGDAVFCDRLNHASLVDGCRLSGAKLRVYPHADVDALDRELVKAAGARRKLIVTDSLFSMDGDAAPLDQLAEAAERRGAMLLVDEAHATGVFGPSGRGMLEEIGVSSSTVIKVGTLSKALGSQGGFVAASRELVDWLFNSARTQMFSTALAPAACAAASAALAIVRNEPERRMQLLEQSEQLRVRLRDIHAEVPTGTIGPIIPVILGEPEQATRIARELEDRECLVACIRPPTVPRNTARLRISMSAAMRPWDVERLQSALAELISQRRA